MTTQVFIFDVFFEKDPHFNVVEIVSFLSFNIFPSILHMDGITNGYAVVN